MSRDAGRVLLSELRSIAAIHGGRVEVRPATTPGDSATFVLRGDGGQVALLADAAGSVCRHGVSAWIADSLAVEARAVVTMRIPKIDR